MVWFLCASPRSKPTRRPPYERLNGAIWCLPALIFCVETHFPGYRGRLDRVQGLDSLGGSNYRQDYPRGDATSRLYLRTILCNQRFSQARDHHCIFRSFFHYSGGVYESEESRNICSHCSVSDSQMSCRPSSGLMSYRFASVQVVFVGSMSPTSTKG